MKFLLLALLTTALAMSATQAHDNVSLAGNSTPIEADSHAPIGVMGDHLHKAGEWMVSYRFMQMRMEDNLRGSDSISPQDIVTQVTNPHAPPATVRVVPLEMTTDMHMLGLMYAPSDDLTLMVMLNYVEKTMEHLTFMGMMGSNTLGQFSAQTRGIGDTSVTGLWRLLDSDIHKMHLNLGLSLPTGSTDEKDDVLSPMNTRPILRLPYAMQLGSGTYDLMPGITYTGHRDQLGWGGQYIATLRLGENDENYTLGDKHQLTAWGSYRITDSASISLRVSYLDESDIDGADILVSAPVITANPANYGGERVDLGIGLNLVGQQGIIRGHRLALEYLSTIDQNANGVQMEMQAMLTLGYQYAY
jgi:hypothetical protein